MKQNRRMSTCNQPVGFANTRISTDYSPKSPRSPALMTSSHDSLSDSLAHSQSPRSISTLVSIAPCDPDTQAFFVGGFVFRVLQHLLPMRSVCTMDGDWITVHCISDSYDESSASIDRITAASELAVAGQACVACSNVLPGPPCLDLLLLSSSCTALH
jgi:hypothetical protein